MTDIPADRADVLVIGGGPSGAAAAYWLARAGHDVLVVEKKRFPREKTCGDGLTPRAVTALDEMGLAEGLEGYHRYDGLRAVAHGITLEMPWPEHPRFPSHGYVVRRRELDRMVADHGKQMVIHCGYLPVMHTVAALPPELCPYYEYLINWNEYGQWFYKNKCQPEDGIMPLPPGPGLGLELDESRIETREEL